jgi:hypothetical protein
MSELNRVAMAHHSFLGLQHDPPRFEFSVATHRGHHKRRGPCWEEFVFDPDVLLQKPLVFENHYVRLTAPL